MSQKIVNRSNNKNITNINKKVSAGKKKSTHSSKSSGVKKPVNSSRKINPEMKRRPEPVMKKSAKQTGNKKQTPTNFKKRKRQLKRRHVGYTINIGVIAFILIFIYVSIYSIAYIFREKISIYEVVKGKSETIPSINATGIVLRNEIITTTSSTGYINFYVRDGGRVAVGSNVYSVDENGAFSQALKETALNESTLSKENISQIKGDIKNFVIEFDNNNFSSAYDFKYQLDSKLIENINLNALETVNNTLEQNGGTTLALNKADTAGIVELYTDGYEGITPETVTSELFDKLGYKRTSVSKDEPVESGSAVYKTIINENWTIVVPLTDEQYTAYAETEAVDIFFPTENLQVSANFREIVNNDGKYGVLDLKRYMVRFADKRFVDLQILGESIEGLKIPVSSLAYKEYYTVPIDYLTTGGNTQSSGFLVESISETGETQSEYKSFEIAKTDENFCYINKSIIKEGTILVQPIKPEEQIETPSKYQIGPVAKVEGVYNVNNGLTTFRTIKILSEKNGYYIVESGTTYGLQVYDQIILNSKLVKENQIIFK